MGGKSVGEGGGKKEEDRHGRRVWKGVNEEEGKWSKNERGMRRSN